MLYYVLIFLLSALSLLGISLHDFIDASPLHLATENFQNLYNCRFKGMLFAGI